MSLLKTKNYHIGTTITHLWLLEWLIMLVVSTILAFWIYWIIMPFDVWLIVRLLLLSICQYDACEARPRCNKVIRSSNQSKIHLIIFSSTCGDCFRQQTQFVKMQSVTLKRGGCQWAEHEKWLTFKIIWEKKRLKSFSCFDHQVIFSISFECPVFIFANWKIEFDFLQIFESKI